MTPTIRTALQAVALAEAAHRRAARLYEEVARLEEGRVGASADDRRRAWVRANEAEAEALIAAEAASEALNDPTTDDLVALDHEHHGRAWEALDALAQYEERGDADAAGIARRLAGIGRSWRRAFDAVLDVE